MDPPEPAPGPRRDLGRLGFMAVAVALVALPLLLMDAGEEEAPEDPVMDEVSEGVQPPRAASPSLTAELLERALGRMEAEGLGVHVRCSLDRSLPDDVGSLVFTEPPETGVAVAWVLDGTLHAVLPEGDGVAEYLPDGREAGGPQQLSWSEVKAGAGGDCELMDLEGDRVAVWGRVDPGPLVPRTQAVMGCGTLLRVDRDGSFEGFLDVGEPCELAVGATFSREEGVIFGASVSVHPTLGVDVDDLVLPGVDPANGHRAPRGADPSRAEDSQDVELALRTSRAMTLFLGELRSSRSL